MTWLARRIATTGALLVLAACGGGPATAWEAPCRPCEEPRGDGVPFQWDDGASTPPLAAPYPQGFALTVPVVPGPAVAVPAGVLGRSVEVGAVLGRCWSSALSPEDAQWRDMTLRVSFRSDGHVNGVPRVVHVGEPADAQASARGRRSLFSALDRCTPLALSPSLGQAIAGQIFAIRFTQQRTS